MRGRRRDPIVDADGNFWFRGVGFTRCAPPLWRTPAGVPELNSAVRAMHEDGQGRLWFAGPKALLLFDDGAWHVFERPDGKQITTGIQTLSTLGDGRAVVATRKGPLLLVTPGSEYAQFKIVEHPQGRLCWNLASRPDGTIWVLTFDKLASQKTFLEVFDGTGFRTVLGETEYLNLGRPHRILSTASGDVWLAGEEGIGLYRRGTYQVFKTSGGNQPRAVFCVTEMSEGKLWVGGPGGIHEFNGSDWKPIKTDIDGVHHILKRRDGDIWVASRTGIHRLIEGSWVSNTDAEGLPTAWSYMLLEDRRNRLWAGTLAGLSLYHRDADADPPRTTISEQENPRETAPDGEVHIVYSGVDRWNFTEPARLLFSTRIDGGPWSAFRPETLTSFTGLQTGRHQFEVRASDRNGNVETEPAAFEFAVALPWHHQPAFLLSAAVATIIILFLIGLHIHRYVQLEKTVAKRTASLNEARNELLAYQEHLRSLASAISVIEERDRRQIASDLHDRIGHGLAVCQMQIEMLQRKTNEGEAGEMLERTRSLIQQTIEDARTLTFEISPPVLHELGLEAALEWLADEMQRQHKIRVELLDDGEPKDIGADARGIVFRAVRELLHNIIKHAQASVAKITIQKVGEALRGEVEDDGVGFNVDELPSESKNKSCFGLLSIRERIEYIGGGFECRSSRVIGTRCALIMPLARNENL